MSLSRRRLRTAKQRQCNKLRAGKSTVCIDRIKKQRKIYNFMVGNDQKIAGSPNSFSHDDFIDSNKTIYEYFSTLKGNRTATGRLKTQAIQLPRMSGKSLTYQKALAAMSDNLKIGLVPHENDEETT